MAVTVARERRRAAQEHGLASAARRCSDAAWLEQEGERGRLRPGALAILRVAERGMLERNVVETARPSLAALSSLLAALDDQPRRSPQAGVVEHLLQADGRHFLGALPAGWLQRSTSTCSANGKVFLAFGRARAPAWRGRDGLRARLTTTDPAWSAGLARVRVEGPVLASPVDELETGLAAIAAPVRGVSGLRRRGDQHHRPTHG